MTIIKRSLVALSILLPTSAIFAQRLPPEKPGALISGKVLTPSGKPVALARVRAVRTSPTRWTSPATRSKSDGTFQISGLDVGDYSVCAEAPERFSLVDPCIWLGEPGQKFTTLIAKQQVTGIVVSLLDGRLVQVEVKDPQGLLSEKQVKTLPNVKQVAKGVHIAVEGPNNSVHRELKAKHPTPDGVLYESLLPVNQARVLHVKGYGLTLSNESQIAVTNNHHTVPLTLSKSTQTVRYIYLVSPTVGAK